MKKIIYGAPAGSVGDIITLLPLINASDFTFQTDLPNLRCELLKGTCKIEIRQDYLNDVESMRRYGDLALNYQLSHTHQAIRFLKVFGVYNDRMDLIPKMNLTEEEINYGSDIINKFDKPCLAICPLDARFRTPIDNWEGGL